MYQVISIGSATVDILVKSDAIGIEKNLPQDIIYLPKSSKCDINQSLICSGGGATNSAVSFSRLGLKTASVCLFGQDELSQFIVKDLITDKVDQSLLIRSTKEKTDFSIVLVANDGSRTVLTQRGPTRLESNHISWSKIKKTNWFYISSLEGNIGLLEKLIGLAKENHIKIALNPGNRELAQPSLKPLLRYVDFLLLNQQEAGLLINSPSLDSSTFDKIKTFGSRIIAITNGRQGAHIISSSQTLFSPIINTNPVDELGAGDAFGSTFVAGQIIGHSLNQSLNMAITNSASVVSCLGSKAGLLPLSKLKQLC